jgi:hypothetical protein
MTESTWVHVNGCGCTRCSDADSASVPDAQVEARELVAEWAVKGLNNTSINTELLIERIATALQASRDEADKLRRWKAEAMEVLTAYDNLADSVGGELGRRKVDNLTDYVNRLRSQLAERDAEIERRK